MADDRQATVSWLSTCLLAIILTTSPALAQDITRPEMETAAYWEGRRQCQHLRGFERDDCRASAARMAERVRAIRRPQRIEPIAASPPATLLDALRAQIGPMGGDVSPYSVARTAQSLRLLDIEAEQLVWGYARDGYLLLHPDGGVTLPPWPGG